MTADDFTEAARAEAERLWPMDALPVRALSAAERRDRRIGFELGARWADAQKPTEYQIDVAMDSYAEASGQPVRRPWMEAAIDAYKSAARRNEVAQ